MPSLNGGDNSVGVFGPDEGFRFLIVLGEEAVDGVLKIYDGPEDATLEAPLGEFRKEPFHGIEPGA